MVGFCLSSGFGRPAALRSRDGTCGLQGAAQASFSKRLALRRGAAGLKAVTSPEQTAAAVRVTPELENAFLVGVNITSTKHSVKSPFTTHESLDELALLAATASLQITGRMTQNLAHPNPSTFINSGKLAQIKTEMAALSTCTLLLDFELSPSQQRGIEQALPNAKVLDRTALILDIFASHARTFEGRLQVEMALYKYRLPRLTRMWTHLERQSGAGGVGLRGPGETQLEVDRRLIEAKLVRLNREIESVREHRKRARVARKKSHVPVVALIGYTNSGKSSLMNAMTQAGVEAEDKLFATLDPKVAEVRDVGSIPSVLLTDTVGFIQKLPTQLVAAFRATLEEVKEADILLHVVDISNELAEAQVLSVNEVLKDIGAAGKKQIMAWNKVDQLSTVDRECKAMEAETCPDIDTVAISAHTGFGIEQLRLLIEKSVRESLIHFEILLPYSKMELVSRLHEEAVVEVEEYRPDGTYMAGQVPFHLRGPIAPFACSDEDDDDLTDLSLSGGLSHEERELQMWKDLAKKRH